MTQHKLESRTQTIFSKSVTMEKAKFFFHLTISALRPSTTLTVKYIFSDEIPIMSWVLTTCRFYVEWRTFTIFFCNKRYNVLNSSDNVIY